MNNDDLDTIEAL